MRAADFEYFDTRFAALAHRGGALLAGNEGRENTLHSFGQAVALGYRYLETDVRTTADGVLVAFHDDTLDRVTDATGRLDRLSYTDLRRVRVGGLDPIPTLDELLESFPQARFNIDLKAPGAIEPLARTLRAHRAQRRVCVSAFSQRRLGAFRRLAGPEVATGAGPFEVAGYAYAPAVRRFLRSPAVAVQIPQRYWRDRVPVLRRTLLRAAHAAGRVVHIWTVDERQEMERLIDLGVDGLVCDRIDVLKDVLVERELWEGN